MSASSLLQATRNIGTGLSFIVFPLIFVFAFAVHPGLLHPHLLDPTALISRARDGGALLQFGHALVTLDTALLVVVALHFMKRLDRGPGAWAGFIGAVLAVTGSLALAADKGALCLTMSAFEQLSGADFANMKPGLLAMFSRRGWLVLLWGVVLLPAGFAIQALALLRYQRLSRRQGMLFFVGALLIAAPDGVEAINLFASLLLAIAFVPYGVQLIKTGAAS